MYTKSIHLHGCCTANFPLIQISSILCVNFTVLWHKCLRVFSWASCTSAKHAGSFDCLMTSLILIKMDNDRGTVYGASPAKLPTKPTDELKKKENVCYNTNPDLCRIPGHVSAVFVGLSASAQIPGKTALGWVACPGISHMSYFL